MEPYQRDFVDLLVRYEVVRFGDFTLKSGRKSPYFVNAGQLRTGAAMAGVGKAYAAALRRAGIEPDLVFGPAYKGVPLAVSTAIALCDHGLDVPYGFDRKEAKDHGEGGVFVGTAPADGMKVVLVDDVITSGRSLREAVELLRGAARVEVTAAGVGERGLERGEDADVFLDAHVLMGGQRVSAVERLRHHLQGEIGQGPDRIARRQAEHRSGIQLSTAEMVGQTRFGGYDK